MPEGSSANNQPKSLVMLSCLFYDLPEKGEASLQIIAEEMDETIDDTLIALDQLQKMGAIDISVTGLIVFVKQKDGHRINYPNYSRTFRLNSR